MNFDLKDGLPSVSFTLMPDDATRFVGFMRDCTGYKKQNEQLKQRLEELNPFNRPVIDEYDEYAKAVITLVEMAKQDCGGSARCAQVLLSLYDGSYFQVDLADVFCGLDERHTNAALKAIRYRAELMTEPHQAIENGYKIFEDLWQRWQSLHVAKRYKRHY